MKFLFEDGVMRELIPTRILIERERILTIRIGIVDIFSLIILLFIREEADDRARRGSSTFKNMPFLRVEHALLGARRASSSTLFIIG